MQVNIQMKRNTVNYTVLGSEICDLNNILDRNWTILSKKERKKTKRAMMARDRSPESFFPQNVLTCDLRRSFREEF